MGDKHELKNEQARLVASDTLVGTTIDQRFEVLSQLGTGGMSLVYKAKDKLLDRPVALKVMLPGRASDERMLLRFQQEAKAAMSLNQHNIAPVRSFGIDPMGTPYLVMDYIEGESLSQVLSKEGQLSVQRAISIAAQVCDALEHAHQQGILHRDIKPSNILIHPTEQGEEVKLVDFGIAKVISDLPSKFTQTGEVFGTPEYMSPEQCMGRQLDGKCDIYSLGCVLYEMLTGKTPFQGENAIAIILQHLNESPPDLPKHIPSEVSLVAIKSLQKEPASRFANASEFKKALLACSSSDTTTSKAALRWYHFKDLLRKKKIAVAFAALAIAFGLVHFGSTYLWTNKTETNDVTVQAKSWSDLEVDANRRILSGRYDEAKNKLDQALAVATQKNSLEQRIATTSTLIDLYWIQQEHVQRDKAIESLNQLLAKRTMQPQQEQLITTLQTLIASGKTNSTSDAKRLCEKANNLASYYISTSYLKRSEPYLRVLNAACQKGIVSTTDPLYERIRFNNAIYQYYVLGQKNQAEQLALATLSTTSKATGPADPDLARMHMTLGRFYLEDHKYEAALAEFDAARTIFSQSKRRTHPSVAASLVFMARCCRALNRKRESVQYAEDALDILAAKDFREFTDEEREYLVDLASAYYLTGQLNKAATAAEYHFYDLQKKAPQHRQAISSSLHLLGSIYEQQRRTGKVIAIRRYLDAIKQRERLTTDQLTSG